MGRTPRANHEARQAGLSLDTMSNRSRGRRYFHVGDSAVTHHATSPGSPLSVSSPSPINNHCGLSSAELAVNFDPSHRRGKKQIVSLSTAFDHVGEVDYSVASENLSEESAAFNLGHHDHVKDQRLERLLQHQQEILDRGGVEENTAGIASAALNVKGTLGRGKKMYADKDCKNYMYRNHSGRVDAFGGLEIKEKEKRRCHRDRDCLDHFFTSNQLEPEAYRRARKFFESHVEPPAHATEDVPIGVSTQIDLDSLGFLGCRKGRGEYPVAHIDCDPVSHCSSPDAPRSPLSSYGLSTAGKRKFLVQTNLDSGCRHRFKHETASSPTVCLSASAPSLPREVPPNQTPYWQDDLSEDARAVREEISPGCRGSRENERTGKLRMHGLRTPDGGCKPDPDNAWLAFADRCRISDKMDEVAAGEFVGGLDSPGYTRPKCTDEEIRDEEFKNALGSTKRSFGNAHNRSAFRFDYNDDPTYKAEHVTSDGLCKWGAGHGRKYFDITDHVAPSYEGLKGISQYTSVEGNNLYCKSKIVPPHMNSKGKKDADGFILGEDGKGMFRSKSVGPIFHDTVNDLLKDDDCQSEHSNQVALVGARRKTELMRPQSARNRFPEKDFQKVKPRSVTPRPTSSVNVPLKDRPKWKK